MPAKRRFFTKTKKETTKEQSITEKLQKGEVEFRTTKHIAKNKEEIKKRPHFPSISRPIPEPTSLKLRGSGTSLKIAPIILVSVLAVVLNVWVGVGLYKGFGRWWSLYLVREKLYSQMATWENITQKFPNYRDAYVEGAILAYRLGDKQKEQYFLSNLEILDSNFLLTKTLQQLITLQNER